MIWLIILIPIALLLIFALWYDRKHPSDFKEMPYNENVEIAKAQAYQRARTDHFHGGGTGY